MKKLKVDKAVKSLTIVLFLMVLGIAIGIVVYKFAPKITSTSSDTLAESSTSPSEGSNEVTDSNPSPTVSPTATPSPIPASASPKVTETGLPSSVRTIVSNFYAAYQGQDRTRLESMFTADSTTEMKGLRSQLFTGYDASGEPGGPTLFMNNTVSDQITAYTVVGGTQVGSDWAVTVRESRTTSSGVKKTGVSVVFLLTAAPSGTNTWLISYYSYAGETDKYGAFYTR